MTRSLYVLGATGAGKTVFVTEVLDGVEFGPPVDVHSWRTRTKDLRLRGHRLPGDGLYLGRAGRGTDGLDASSIKGAAAWLRGAGEPLPAWIVGEGRTLAAKSFLAALCETTEALVILLEAEDFVLEIRRMGLGIPQLAQRIEVTANSAEALLAHTERWGAMTLRLDVLDPDAWSLGLDTARTHLGLS